MKKSTQTAVFFLLIIILGLLVLIMTSGCGVHKNISQTHSETDSSINKVRDSAAHVISELNSKHEKELKESSDATIVFNDPPPCPDVAIDSSCNKDSLVKIIRMQEKIINSQSNSIEMGADGSIKATGQLKSLKATNDKYSRQIDDLYMKNDSLVNTHMQDQKQIKELKDASKKVVTRLSFPWWLMLLCFIGGCVFWHYLGSRIKSFIKKIFSSS